MSTAAVSISRYAKYARGKRIVFITHTQLFRAAYVIPLLWCRCVNLGHISICSDSSSDLYNRVHGIGSTEGRNYGDWSYDVQGERWEIARSRRVRLDQNDEYRVVRPPINAMLKAKC